MAGLYYHFVFFYFAFYFLFCLSAQSVMDYYDNYYKIIRHVIDAHLPS
jgi:hypothetical protein